MHGDDFFDRERELEQLARLLQSGSHVSLVAQRRTGKTSLLHAVADAVSEQMTCLYVDLQDARDAPDAVVAIALATRRHQRLWTRAREAFSNVLEHDGYLHRVVEAHQFTSRLLRDWWRARFSAFYTPAGRR